MNLNVRNYWINNRLLPVLIRINWDKIKLQQRYNLRDRITANSNRFQFDFELQSSFRPPSKDIK